MQCKAEWIRIAFGGLAALAVFAAGPAQAARIFVGLLATADANQPQPGKHFAVNFTLTSKTWAVAEPAPPAIFRTRSGPYVVKPDGTYLTDASGKTVGFITAFNPSTAGKTDHRNDGHASETGRTFEWKVELITDN